MTWNSTPVTRLQYFENEVVQRVRSESPELRESNTQCYIIENDDENFFIRDNMLYGVFDEIYSPRRHGTGDRRLFYVSPPAVFRVEAKKDPATFHELTLAKGALILAVGNHKSMQNLFETLNKLVSHAKIINC